MTDKEKELQAEAIDYYRKRTADLEKENAELSMKRKAEIKIFQGIVEKKNDQLTKAKELLKKVLDLKKVVTKAEEYLLLEEAEQFISEVEK